ncbi:MAG: tautomerase family protein [Elusimicrobiota bacterium]
MPCLEITLPKTDRETKAKLADCLTEAFASSTLFGKEIFGVRFFEYGPGEAAVGGRLVDGDEKSPYLHALLYCPRITRSTKQKLAEALTEAFVRGTGREDWRPVIHICEHPYDNVAVEGRVLSEAFEECAKKSFYYELPKD